MDICAHIESLRERLQASNMTRDQVAAATNGALSASWVSKFASGKMRNPRIDSLLALERAIESQPQKAA
ncbi:MAG: XRE family transcriptional regulator [Gammaproteobacteria bacterium]|jgi:transcriptional regulator with XRE-family HTH domain|nr:XRE family transcriptional regulator [Gammaproteobacteria bacterium]